MEGERRGNGSKDRPGQATQLILSYEKMSPQKRKWLFWVGVGLLGFTVALPLVAGIWVELPTVYWGFAVVGFVAGFSCMWPEGGIFLASIAGRFIPTLTLKRLIGAHKRIDRREDDCP